jgi:hypothetical protein
LLDLLEVFREFTEKGRVRTTSSILTSQVANLESATRQIEARAKALTKTPLPIVPSKPSALKQTPPGTATGLAPPGPPGTPPGTYASIASAGDNDWTFVSPKSKPHKAEYPPAKPKKSNRLILVKSTGQATSFSPLALRNAFNKAFADKGVKGPVVTSISKSLGQNLVVTTTSQFSAEYLLENQAIWEHITPFQQAQKDEPWHKVVLHGIPIADFDNPTGMDLIIEEIKTFNKGFSPIGTPHWLTSQEKRQNPNQQAGSVVVAFATTEEANRAIRHRLYIAGISVRVEKLYTTASTTQCQKCQGFGHLENHCKYSAICRLCAGKHSTKQHHCTTCSAKGTRCPHLVPKCANCKEAHTADLKSCEVLIAIKKKKATTTL